MPRRLSALYDARQVIARLPERGDRVHAVQEDLRKAIATISIPDEHELKKLSRYRKLLEEDLQRLAALDQLRKLSVASARTEAEKAAATAYRVKLRVVAWPTLR